METGEVPVGEKEQTARVSAPGVAPIITCLALRQKTSLLAFVGNSPTKRPALPVGKPVVW